VARWKSGVEELKKSTATPGKLPAVAARVEAAERAFIAAIEDDLHVPRAVEAALGLLEALSGNKLPSTVQSLKAIERFDQILGFSG
jgi:cysteinyl-tRNA synthetase